jgi:hypothetical protein
LVTRKIDFFLERVSLGFLSESKKGPYLIAPPPPPKKKSFFLQFQIFYKKNYLPLKKVTSARGSGSGAINLNYL